MSDQGQLRSDARSNLERVLAAAAEVFAARGLGATLADIAKHAGVGVGTVYRRFANKDDLAMLGFAAGQRVDITSVWDDGIERRADSFLLVEYDIPRGCLGAYYPETNPLVPLASVADGAGTPTSKSIPVLLHRSAPPAAGA